MLKRHILKNNKHSSVPFWWPRGPRQAQPPPGSLLPRQPEPARQAAPQAAPAGRGWRGSEGAGGVRVGWEGLPCPPLTPSPQRLSPTAHTGRFGLRCACGLTSCTSRSRPAAGGAHRQGNRQCGLPSHRCPGKAGHRDRRARAAAPPPAAPFPVHHPPPRQWGPRVRKWRVHVPWGRGLAPCFGVTFPLGP